jgi:hypothetical protein
MNSRLWRSVSPGCRSGCATGKALLGAARKVTVRDTLDIVRGGDDSSHFTLQQPASDRRTISPIVSRSIGKLRAAKK